MKGLLESLTALGPMRLAAMAVVALGTLALLASVALMGTGGGESHMALLYADLDPRDASNVNDQLDRAHIPHQLDGDGSRVMVPADQVPSARLLLAKQGLPTGGSIGYEIFDRGDGMTASEFQQQINQTRALEGELTRSIVMITGIRGARVHIVLPHREPFARDRQEAQASVLLTMAGAARLDSAGVQAIVNLVAAGVPGLKAQNVSVVDSRGTLLAKAGDIPGADAKAAAGDELRRATERRLTTVVQEMLERSLGPGHVQAQAAVEMDYQQTKQVDESYNPDGQVPRSTQTVTDNSKSTEAPQAVTVQNNLPNANAANPGAGSQEQRQEETTNYEIGKTVRTVQRDVPQIRRISVAVMVDGVAQPDASGKLVWHERSPEELARIAALVRGAVGYDEKRGDHVEVVSMSFAAPEDAQTTSGPNLFGIPLERNDLIHLGETLIFGALGLMALLFVLKPMVHRLTTPDAPIGIAMNADGEPMPVSMVVMGEDGRARLAQPGEAGAVPLSSLPPSLVAMSGLRGLPGAPIDANAQALLGVDDDTMVRLANIEGQMRASVVRRIQQLVEKHPDETVGIIRGWMLESQVPS